MGAVNARKRGMLWQYYFEGAKIDGKRQRICKSGYNTKKDALEAGNKALAEYNNSGIHFTPSELSFSDYLDYWIKNYCEVNLKSTTIDGYNKKIKLHIKPVLGKYKLKAITPSILQQFINNKFNEGYSRNTLVVLKALLSGCLSYAVQPCEFIQSNPMMSVKLPSTRAKADVSTRRKEKAIVTKEQVTAILKRFPEGHPCHIPLQLAYRCGLRLGEVFGLSWDDINFEHSTLSVNRQIQMDEKTKKWTFSNPKYDSFRTIKLDSTIVELLKNAKKSQEDSEEEYGEFYTNLFVDENDHLNSDGSGTVIKMVNVRENGTYIQPRVTQHLGRVIHYELGFKQWDFHSLRHTHTTVLIEAGANIKDVQNRLGHKNIGVTLQIYTHVTEKMQNDTVLILEKALSD